MSIFFFFIQRYRCNELAKVLTIYLINSKIKKRVVNILSNFNVCVLYIIAQKIIKKLKQINIVEIRTRGFRVRDIIINNIIIYDNYDFVEHKSIERLNSRKTQRDITIAL